MTFRLRLLPLDSPRRDERGETLIELMATSILMGLAIVAIVAALLNTVIASDNHRRSTRAGNEAVRLSEAVIAANYVKCTNASPPATEYAKVYDTGGTIVAPTGYTYEIVSVGYLQNRTAATPVFNSTCPTTDQGAQRVEVAVASAGRSAVRETIVVVKRDPA